tara:strand:+ start:6845 stop:7108 length:264 start_codon:yes stop_codon:yes gene_type:complete
MAFIGPAFAELVLNAGEATAGAGFVSNIFHHFEEPIKKFAVDEVGKLTGEYAKSHPGSMVDQAITSANNYRGMKKTRTTRVVRKLSR